MDLYQLSVVVSYCLLSEGLFKGTNIIKGKETLTKTLQSLTNTYWTHTNTNNERHTNKNHIEITHIHCIY